MQESLNNMVISMAHSSKIAGLIWSKKIHVSAWKIGIPSLKSEIIPVRPGTFLAFASTGQVCSCAARCRRGRGSANRQRGCGGMYRVYHDQQIIAGWWLTYWGDDIPNIWKNESHVWNHQPDNLHSCCSSCCLWCAGHAQVISCHISCWSWANGWWGPLCLLDP